MWGLIFLLIFVFAIFVFVFEILLASIPPTSPGWEGLVFGYQWTWWDNILIPNRSWKTYIGTVYWCLQENWLRIYSTRTSEDQAIKVINSYILLIFPNGYIPIGFTFNNSSNLFFHLVRLSPISNMYINTNATRMQGNLRSHTFNQ